MSARAGPQISPLCRAGVCVAEGRGFGTNQPAAVGGYQECGEMPVCRRAAHDVIVNMSYFVPKVRESSHTTSPTLSHLTVSLVAGLNLNKGKGKGRAQRRTTCNAL